MPLGTVQLSLMLLPETAALSLTGLAAAEELLEEATLDEVEDELAEELEPLQAEAVRVAPFLPTPA